MNEPPPRANLADIIGSDQPDHRRVAAFVVGDDSLAVVEMCDEWFGVTLNAAELDLLISWLTNARNHIKAHE